MSLFVASQSKTLPHLVVFALMVFLAAGCGSSDPAEDPAPEEQENPAVGQPAEPITTPASAAPADPEQLLRQVASAYKRANSYADAGRVRLVAEVDGEEQEQIANFAVTLKRPNQLRVEVYQAMIVSDGETVRAALQDLPGQVAERPAPEEITVADLEYDDVLTKAWMAGAFAGSPPQLTLLLAEDPVAMLTQDMQKSTLSEPAAIDGQPCHRLQFERPDGTGVFWIDQRTLVLRRLEYPTDQIRRAYSQGATVGEVTLVAEFEGARFDQPIDPVAFQFEVPEGARVVDFLIPPHPAQLLGEKVPSFEFTDLAGNPITPESLRGKVAVVVFWASTWKPSLESLQQIAQVRQAVADRQEVVWLAAAVDPPEIENQTLEQALEERGVRLPIVRDSKQDWNLAFHAGGQLPLIVVVDASGIVQDFHVLETPDDQQELAASLSEKLRSVLAGNDIYEAPLAEYQRQLEEYGQWLKERSEKGAGEDGGTATEIPRAKVADRSEPQQLRLSPLFTCTELDSPGNIAVLRGADGKNRLLVIEGYRKLVELGLDGKVIARHELDVDPEQEMVTKLRTGADRSGGLLVAAFAPGGQRMHLLDGSFKRRFSFPENALENPHPGIADVALTDLEADVGYWGVVGLQRVGLDGQRVWSNRRIADVGRLAPGPVDEKGRRDLYCTNSSGALAQIDAEGNLVGQLAVRNRGLHWATAADLTGSGQPEFCGLAATPEHRNVAVGFDTSGKELWNYPLPLGVHERPVEEIVPGHLVPGATGQWILPGGDGSIHILTPDGKPIERFNYGARLTGVATAEHNGRGVLVVATDEKVEAWLVQ